MRRACSVSALSALLLILILFLDFVRSQTNQTLSAIDPRLTYVGEWTEQDNGGHTFTSQAGSFSLDFQGTAIYWFSRRIHDGAIASVSLDDEDLVNIDLSEGMTEDDAPAVEVLFQRTGLDGNENHRFTVSWGGPGGTGLGSFLENYRIIYTVGGDTVSASSDTSSPGEVSTSTSSTGEAFDGESETSEFSSSPNPNSNPTPTSVPTSAIGAPGTMITTSSPSPASASGPSATSSSDPSPDPNSVFNPDSDSESSSASDPGSSNGNTGAIVGGVVGGVLGLLLASALLWLWRRRAQRPQKQETASVTPFMPSRAPPDDPIASPFLIKPSVTSYQTERGQSDVRTSVTPESTLFPSTTNPVTSMAPRIPATNIRDSIHDPPPVYTR